MTFPSLLSHHRKTMPQPCREASQVMMTMRASPVSPAEKAAWRVLGTKGQRGATPVAELHEDVVDEDGGLAHGGG